MLKHTAEKRWNQVKVGHQHCCVCMYSGEVSVHGLCQNQIAPLRATSRALIVSAAGEDERKWAFIHWALKRAVNNQPNGVARMMGPGRRSRVVRRSWKRESARGQLPQRLTECLGPLNTHTHTHCPLKELSIPFTSTLILSLSHCVHACLNGSRSPSRASRDSVPIES